MSVALDTNIIIYALDARDPKKHSPARSIFDAAVRSRAIVPSRVVGEMLNVAHKKQIISVSKARELAALIAQEMVVVSTPFAAFDAASRLAERYRLQFFDALICTVAASAGARILLTEDMHDGLKLGPLMIVDPFKDHNAALVEAALPL